MVEWIKEDTNMKSVEVVETSGLRERNWVMRLGGKDPARYQVVKRSGRTILKSHHPKRELFPAEGLWIVLDTATSQLYSDQGGGWADYIVSVTCWAKKNQVEEFCQWYVEKIVPLCDERSPKHFTKGSGDELEWGGVLQGTGIEELLVRLVEVCKDWNVTRIHVNLLEAKNKGEQNVDLESRGTED
jgi:hypothetical protein